MHHARALVGRFSRLLVAVPDLGPVAVSVQLEVFSLHAFDAPAPRIVLVKLPRVQLSVRISDDHRPERRRVVLAQEQIGRQAASMLVPWRHQHVRDQRESQIKAVASDGVPDLGRDGTLGIADCEQEVEGNGGEAAHAEHRADGPLAEKLKDAVRQTEK